MNNLQNVIDKVKKLLALSKSSNQNEAANATAAANRLIDEYRLSENDLNDSDMIVDNEFIYETGRVIPWKRGLIYVLSNHYGVAVINQCDFSNGRCKSRFKLIGNKSDVQIVKYMFAWLTSEITRLSNIEAKGKGHIFVFSYCEGFVAGIKNQLDISRSEAKKSATTEAIVKIDSRLEQSNEFMCKKFNTETKKFVSKRRFDSGAYYDGVNKGENTHLGRSLENNNKLLS